METVSPTIPHVFDFLKDVPTESQTLEKGTYVFRENEGCGRIGFVLSGSIRVVKEHTSGKNITLYRIGPGDSCILSMSCALSNPIHQASAIVEEDAEVITVGTGDFRSLLDRSNEAREYVFGLFATRLTDVMILVEEIVFHRMDERLAAALIDNAARHHTDTVVATHEQLAEETGTAREVVTRILRDFSARGWVEIHRGSVKILDKKGLLSKC
ncbi:MAG: Crp/Fnr family transcriptional regulator [Candidatus Kapabacteria bacterium]|nr:Crp/Fnr family transcriptional regulator [Candidatus Kapabacteria bacterium]